MDSSGTVRYYWGDHLGTTRIVTDAAGNVCYDADFYPFQGERAPYVSNCTPAYKFAGMKFDQESGNYYTLNRSYPPNLGRWLSPDPVAGSIYNPQSLNRYAYVLNNPVNFIDPLGLQDQPNHPLNCAGGDFWACVEKYFCGTLYCGYALDQWVATSNEFRLMEIPSSQVPIGFNVSVVGTIPGSDINVIVIQPVFAPGLTVLLPGQSPGGGTLPPDQQQPQRPQQPPASTKWWPSKDTSSCSIYPEGGILRSVCEGAKNGPIANSIRGCLQASYIPDFGYAPLATVSFSITVPSTADLIRPIDVKFGLLQHAYCLPMGALYH